MGSALRSSGWQLGRPGRAESGFSGPGADVLRVEGAAEERGGPCTRLVRGLCSEGLLRGLHSQAKETFCPCTIPSCWSAHRSYTHSSFPEHPLCSRDHERPRG